MTWNFICLRLKAKLWLRIASDLRRSFYWENISMVAAASWMYVVDWGPWIWQMLCKSFAYDIERYFWRVVDSIWSFVVSETKTKWNVYCVARQYHDSRYVHWIRRIYTCAVDIATRRGFFQCISHCSKRKFDWRKRSIAQNNLKPFLCTSQWFCLLVSLTFSTIYQQPDSRILESSSFILFELTKRDLNTTQK